jgi:glyoxylase-like metal-dependent hydrolase (beta-lactamase superfamily II)
MNRMLLSVTILAAAAVPALAQPQPAPPPERSFTEVAENLYRYQDGGWFGMVLVTDEGILIADPLNRGGSEWLAGELETRFDVPVRYIVYSHHHADHASGAAVWPDATVIAHELSATALTPPGEDAPLTGASVAADANGDGKIQQSEANPGQAGRFAELDLDGDGGLSARELFASQFGETSTFGGVRLPDETWSGAEHTITLGGQEVRLVKVAAAHAADLAYVLFPAQRTLFVVDVINLKRLPIIGATFTEEDLDTVTEAALAHDVDVVVPGHGDIGNKDDVEAHRAYHQEILAGVRAGIAAGQSLEEIQASLPMEEYSAWSAFERHPQNIAGAYAALSAD